MRPIPASDGGVPSCLRPAWVEVDLDSLEHNLQLLRGRVRPAEVLAVIKADAYGHGAPMVARCLEENGVGWLAVALVEEAVELRSAGVSAAILVIGVSTTDQLPLYRRYGLTPAISSTEQLQQWLDWAPASAGSTPLQVHLKIDVGMHRLGLAPEELPHSLRRIREHRGLELGGLLSHLAVADDLSNPRTREQEQRFSEAVKELVGVERQVMLHLANSAAALHHPGTRFTLVRSGLALLGIDPVGRQSGLRQVMRVSSRILQLKTVATGAQPGYGGTWTAQRSTRLGLIPVGYADGFSWRLSNKASVLLDGRRYPVVGAVSMDMTLIDLTDAHGVGLGDEVVVLGRQRDEEITAAELAELAGTIPYEILCHFGLRLPRCYRRGGKIIAHDSRFANRFP